MIVNITKYLDFISQSEAIIDSAFGICFP